jgi:hypothetical protein
MLAFFVIFLLKNVVINELLLKNIQRRTERKETHQYNGEGSIDSLDG